MNIQLSKIKKNGSPLRKGIGWLATLVCVAILVLLVACPAASSGDGNTSGPVTVTLTDQTLDTITIAVKTSAFMTGDNVLWWAVYASTATLPTDADDRLAAIKAGTFGSGGNAVNAVAKSGVNGTAVRSGSTLTDSGTADETRTFTADSTALTATNTYDVYVAVGNGHINDADNTDRILSTKNNLAVTDVAAAAD